MSATERFIDALIGHGKKVKPAGDRKWIAQCPAHDDGNPSLSVGEGRGQVLLFCFAGCGHEEIAAAIGWTVDDLFDDPKGVTYEYKDRGKTVRRVHRTPSKRFRQDVIEEGTGALYVPEHVDLDGAIKAGVPVFIPEGEKDVDTLTTIGESIAVTSAGGAQAWSKADWSRLAGKSELVVVADPDKPGLERATALVKHLRTLTEARVFAVKARTGKDATDHILAGHTVTEFVQVDVDYDPEFEARVDDLLWERRARQVAADREKQIKAAQVSTKLDPKQLGDILNLQFTDDWLIPGLLERGDRLMLTGVEGGGKSFWLRQVSICAAAGVHPFTKQQIAPKRVLVVDTENSERQWSRTAKYVTEVAAGFGDADPRRNVVVAAGVRIDLTVQADVNQLHKLVDEVRPDILQIGPLYKLVSGEITNDNDAAPLIEVLDGFRERGLVLLMEAHAGHAGKQSKDLRPRGSSALLGWPEFGFGLLPDSENEEMVDLVRWRGDREARDWPNGFRRGLRGELPWEALKHV